MYVPWKLKLPRICAFWTESRQDFTIDIENLNTVVIGVGYNNSVCIAYSDVMGMLQVTRFTSHYTEFAHEWAVRLENLKNKSVFENIFSLLFHDISFENQYNENIPRIH